MEGKGGEVVTVEVVEMEIDGWGSCGSLSGS